MVNLKKIIFLAFICLASQLVVAAGTVSGTVEKIRVDHGPGMAMIYFSNNISGDHGDCRGGVYKNVLSVDLEAKGGSEALSVALAAYATKASIKAYGKGHCNVYGDGVAEVLDAIILK